MGGRRRGGLWRQRHFRLLWGGEAVSDLGDAIGGMALPLVAVTVLHASALEVSTLTAATYLPYLVLGLPAGAWVDRLPCRPLMVGCDLVQLVVWSSLPVAYALGRLSYGQLLAVALLAGTCAMLFSSSYSVYVTALVEPAHLMEANSKLQGTGSVTRVVGPGLGGLVAQAIGPVPTLLLDAGSFLVSVVTLRQIPVRGERTGRPDEVRTIRGDIAEGLRFVFHDRYLRPLTIWAATANFGIAGYFALIVVFLVRTVGLRAGLVGLLLTAGGLAGVLGALGARRLTERFGTARTLVATCSVAAPCGFLMVFASRGPQIALAVVGISGLEGGLVLASIVLASFNQGYVPGHLLGRVATSTRLVTYGIAPIGALVAGGLAGALGTRQALGAMLAVDVAAVGLLLTGPFRGRRDLPVREADDA